MANTTVVIVGAGPSGLVLGLSLAQHRVKSIIVEKELGITTDPRGVYLSGDAVRVLWSLGVQHELATIGHEQGAMLAHKGSLSNKPFFGFDTASDWRYQAVPDGIMQIQPELERVLRQKVEASQYCQLRSGCEVTSIEELAKGMRVQYNHQGESRAFEASWVVGADGKRGYVRKHYLEPVAGIIQEPGLFAYEGTWIAANLHIKLPTPEAHPDIPLWKLGKTPEDVYDLFFPEHLHFISPPAKPTATMRFGPHESRLWRHEFAEPNWNDSIDVEAQLWEQILPMLTRDNDGKGCDFPQTTFPRDCIEIHRCTPYSFVQKVVNKWYYGRTILIGDAAHVFPPFGGQGIATGIRDAQALAWRLALFDQQPRLTKSAIAKVLDTWAQERKQGVDDSARFTKGNGILVNGEETWSEALLRNVLTFSQKLPFMPHIRSDVERAEVEAYKPVENGCFSAKYQGGGKAAQVYLRTNDNQIILSDQLLQQHTSLMTLVDLDGQHRDEVEQIVAGSNLPEFIISKCSIVRVGSEIHASSANDFQIPSLTELEGQRLRKGYDPHTFKQRFGSGAKYVVLRPDFIAYSVARTLSELQECLQYLRFHLEC